MPWNSILSPISSSYCRRQRFLDLVAGIRAHGLSVPITLLGDIIVDARVRDLG